MRIRPADPEDVPAVLALWDGARSAAAVTGDTPESVRLLLERDAGGLLVAVGDDGAVVGAIVAGWDAGAGTYTGSPSPRRAGAPGSAARSSPPPTTACAPWGRGA